MKSILRYSAILLGALFLAGLMGLNKSYAQTGWISQSSGTANHLQGVCFTDANTGTAIGEGGTILRTEDGGASWQSQSSGTTNWLWGVCYTDANTGTAVGEGGTILRTTNGGANWTRQDSWTIYNLSGVSFTDANTGTAVGDFGTIIRMTNGVVVRVKDDPHPTSHLPREPVLEQNYPNPFNPATTISYAFPKASVVRLAVYDMLGREVAVLVNEMQAPGSYEVKFNASELTTGVYLYRLTAGDIAQTRRMIVVK